MDIVFEEEHLTVSLLMSSKRIKYALDRSIPEPQPSNGPVHPVSNQPIEVAVAYLRRSQRITRFTFLNDYIYLYQNDFNIGQVNNPNTFVEAISCLESDSG